MNSWVLRYRRLMRAALALIAVSGTSVVLVSAVVHRQASVGLAPTVAPHEGWRIRGARHVFYDGSHKVANLEIGEAGVHRVGVGIFRLGFAHRLVVRDFRADVLVSGQDGERDGPLRSLQLVLEKVGGSLPVKSNLLTGIRVEEIVLRLHSPTGAWMELSADHADADVLSGSRVVFRGAVRVKGESTELAFSRLTYDQHARRFVHDSTGRAGNAAIDAANRFLVSLMGEDYSREGDHDDT